MNREIKFKCLITDNNKNIVSEFFEWLDGDGWKHSYYLPLVTSCVFDHQELGDGWFGEIIRLEYIGVSDKKGNEIYEGDIMKVTQRTEGRGKKTKFKDFFIPVEFYNGGFHLPFIDYGEYRFRSGGMEDYEVVGNIYENASLLINVATR